MNHPAAPTAAAGWVYPTPTQPVPAPVRRVPAPPGLPGSRPPRRTGLVVALVAAGVGLLTLAVTAALLVVHAIASPQTLSSANGVVTLQVPGSWDDLTSVDAGQSATAADEDDAWVVPDVEAADFLGDAHLSVWVSDSSEDSSTAVQQELVANTCDDQGCLSRGTPTATTVAGRPAVQQLLRHPAGKDVGSSTSLVVSLTQGATVVSLVIWWDELADPDTAALLRSLTLTR